MPCLTEWSFCHQIPALQSLVQVCSCVHISVICIIVLQTGGLANAAASIYNDVTIVINYHSRKHIP